MDTEEELGLELDLSDFTPSQDYLISETQARCIRQYIRNVSACIGKGKRLEPSEIAMIKYDMDSAAAIMSELERV